MKRTMLFFVVFCCFLLFSGCSQSSSSEASPSVGISTPDTSEKSVEYQEVSIGGYSTILPINWTVEEGYFYLNPGGGYPYIAAVVLEEPSSLEDLFSYSGAEEEFVAGIVSEIFDEPLPDPDYETSVYNEISGFSFNTTGYVEKNLISFSSNIFDNPGGGVLAVMLFSEAEDVATAIHDYLYMFYHMEPSANTETPPQISTYHFSDGTTTMYCRDVFEYEVPSHWQTEIDIGGNCRLASPASPDLYMSIVFIHSPDALSTEDEFVVSRVEDYLSRFTGEDESGKGDVFEIDNRDAAAIAYGAKSGNHYATIYTFIDDYEVIYYFKSPDSLSEYIQDASSILSSVTPLASSNVEKNVSSSEEPSEEEYEPTVGEHNARIAAKDYLDIMAFSYSGIIQQLEYEGYEHSEAVYAADNCGADWNEQAIKAAKEYLDVMPFSRSELANQLVHDGFTQEQAEYGVSQVYDK